MFRLEELWKDKFFGASVLFILICVIAAAVYFLKPVLSDLSDASKMVLVEIERNGLVERLKDMQAENERLFSELRQEKERNNDLSLAQDKLKVEKTRLLTSLRSTEIWLKKCREDLVQNKSELRAAEIANENLLAENQHIKLNLYSYIKGLYSRLKLSAPSLDELLGELKTQKEPQKKEGGGASGEERLKEVNIPGETTEKPPEKKKKIGHLTLVGVPEGFWMIDLDTDDKFMDFYKEYKGEKIPLSVGVHRIKFTHSKYHPLIIPIEILEGKIVSPNLEFKKLVDDSEKAGLGVSDDDGLKGHSLKVLIKKDSACSSGDNRVVISTSRIEHKFCMPEKYTGEPVASEYLFWAEYFLVSKKIGESEWFYLAEKIELPMESDTDIFSVSICFVLKVGENEFDAVVFPSFYPSVTKSIFEKLLVREGKKNEKELSNYQYDLAGVMTLFPKEWSKQEVAYLQ